MSVRTARGPRAKTQAGRAANLRAAISDQLSLDPIITMNSGGIIQSASESVERVFGWTPDELLGRNLRVLIPEPRRSALDRYLDRYRNPDRAKSSERSRRFDGVRKDGSLLQIELSVSRADIPTQSEPYFIGIIRDISRVIDVGDNGNDNHARLQQLVTDQTRALATASLRLYLADRMASLGTLAAGLGHDMNNVLLPVRARLNALERAKLDPESLRHVRSMRRSVAYLQHLSDGLHYLSLNPENGVHSDPLDEATSLHEWWRQVGSLLRHALPEHVRLRAKLPSSLPLVLVAPHRLTQAMLNLVVNAGESFRKGTNNGIVRIWARADADRSLVKLGVTDNGRGMSADTKRRAFDLFFTTKARALGTGLGLPLARKVAVRAKGEIELESRVGVGTTVTMLLPSTPRVPRPPAARASKLTATVTVRDPRMSALLAQILVAAGILARSRREGPGRTDLWITEPNAASLRAATRWRGGNARRAPVVLGAPTKLSARKWAELGAAVIDPPDDYEGIRHVLGEAIDRLKTQTPGGGKP